MHISHLRIGPREGLTGLRHCPILDVLNVELGNGGSHLGFGQGHLVQSILKLPDGSALRLTTVRTDEQLDAARADVLDRVARMRAGEFTATPGKPCQWCDYARMCPERAG